MQMRTFRGGTLEECFQQVKLQMGREAVILTSNQYKPILGRFGSPRYEVVAALDLNIGDQPLAQTLRDQAAPRPTAPSSTMGTSSARPGDRPVYGYSTGSGRAAADERPTLRPTPRNADTEAFARRAPEPAPPSMAEYDQRMERLENQLSTLATTMQKIAENSAIPAPIKKSAKKVEPFVAQALEIEREEARGPYFNLAKRLADAEIASPLVRRWIGELPAGLTDQAAATEIRTKISQNLLLADRLESQPGKTRVLAFLGATGVGKTTTLTKIAARLSLLTKHKVGIVTMDTHRIAAAKQLETYGEILRVPVKVAYSAEDVLAAVSKFAEEKMDFVLIDTAGKSPNDALPLAEIASTLKEIATVTRYLCVPATLSSANVDHMVARFHSLLAPDGLILTKLDESANNAYLGHLLNTQAKYALPLAYITNGQRVPDDLAIADPHIVADKILPQAEL